MTETSIKKRCYISLTKPATNTIAGYTALTWSKIGGVVTIGQIGFNHATIEAPDLETGITQTLKGARSGTGGQIAFRQITADAGQTAVATANEGETEVALQIVDPDGTNSDYWTGIIHSLVDNEASTTTYEGSTFTFVPNYARVRGASDIA